MTKPERVKIILGRLLQAEPASDRESANQLIKDVVNSVEDEFSGLPYDVTKSNDRMCFYYFRYRRLGRFRWRPLPHRS